MNTQEKGIIMKNSHSSTGRWKILMLLACISLNPHTPFFVNIISQIIKKAPVIKIAGNKYLKFSAYLNLLSHEAAKGNDIVNNRR
tara:strand:- start:131 stop:385 length:255 start_codon:yes stop_codon:yes gene_type:complete